MKALYRHRTYRAGNTIEVEETYPTRFGDLLTREKHRKPTPEAMRLYNEEVAIRKLTRLMNENFVPNDWFITLHYEDHNRPKTLEEAEENLSRFIRKLRTVYKKNDVELKYVKRTAFGDKGAVHHHIVIPKGVEIREINTLWRTHIRSTIKARPPECRALYDTGEYSGLAAYIVRQYSGDNPYIKKWIGSRNLKKPKLEKYKDIEEIKWQEPPVARDEYYIDTDSIRAGCNPLTNRPYLFYRMVKLPPDFVCYDKQGNRLCGKEAIRYFRADNKKWIKDNWDVINPEGDIVFKDTGGMRQNE